MKTTTTNRADAPMPWQAQAAYLYILDLDGQALAWEYLRRHPGYRAEWLALGRRADVRHWGLSCRRRSVHRRAPRESSVGARH